MLREVFNVNCKDGIATCELVDLLADLIRKPEEGSVEIVKFPDAVSGRIERELSLLPWIHVWV
jgi:hypothetical protein